MYLVVIRLSISYLLTLQYSRGEFQIVLASDGIGHRARVSVRSISAGHDFDGLDEAVDSLVRRCEAGVKPARVGYVRSTDNSRAQ